MEDIDKREADLLWIQNEKEESEAKDIERLKGYSPYVLFDEFILPLPDDIGFFQNLGRNLFYVMRQER